MSFALPKGLPGNPNSKSLGRMAIETRVHNLWNHLIESASAKTGSLLIWDTGTYEVLPRKMAHHHKPSQHTTDEDSSSSSSDSTSNSDFDDAPRGTLGSPNRPKPNNDDMYQNEMLIEAFKTRYIRLRLHGTRLPKNYTVTLRLPSANDFGKKTARRRRKHATQPHRSTLRPRHLSYDSTDSETDIHHLDHDRRQSDQDADEQDENEDDIDTDTDEDATTRLHNAYPGSTNSIGSIHQRHWFLMLDRRSSGFLPSQGKWQRDGDAGFEPFLVRGRDYERSVVTGRLAREVEADEAVEGYVGRAGWIGIEH